MKKFLLKNSIFIVALLFLFFSCSKDNTDDKETIIGKWQVFEYCENIGDGTWGCTDIDNGYTIHFGENEIFNFSEGNSECLTGTFTYNSEKISLQFNSDVCSINDGIVVYDYAFIDNSLKLSLSIENSNCDEGCYERFKRISIEE